MNDGMAYNSYSIDDEKTIIAVQLIPNQFQAHENVNHMLNVNHSTM